MKSTCSIFAAKAFFSLLATGLCLGAAPIEENYSLWPRRPDTFASVRTLVSEGKIDDAAKNLEPLIKRRDIIGQEAKAMLGDLRIRQILSPSSPGLNSYTAKRGDTWLKIARKTKCPLDYIIHINQMTELGVLRIGQDIKYRELKYRIEINVPEKEISIWDGESFIKSYPITMMKDVGKSNFSTSVRSETGMFGDQPVTPSSPEFSAADKTISLSHGGLVIDSSGDGKMNKSGFYLKREDCNELALLLQPGNTVDIIREVKR